ncbi:hypothetical protein QYF36_025292 [Acer negundo]|nr:hypothetical protein QYF36_025292 [Acer negundo]
MNHFQQHLSYLLPIKYTKHRNATKKFMKPTMVSREGHRRTRVVRISMTNNDTMDSCSDEEGELFGRLTAASASTNRRKFKGVRQQASGRWAAEIRDPSKCIRLWLGKFNTAASAVRAYDEEAISFRGRNALTNFPMTHLSSKSKVIDPGKLSKPIPENTVLTVTAPECQVDKSNSSASDDLLLDLPFFNEFFNNVPTTGLSFLDQNDTVFQHNNV